MSKWKSIRNEGEAPESGNYFLHWHPDSDALDISGHHEFEVGRPGKGVTHYREMDGTSLEQAIREFHQTFWHNPLTNLYQLRLVIKNKFLSIFMN